MEFSIDRGLQIHEWIESLYPKVERRGIRFRGLVEVSRSIPPPGDGGVAATDNDRTVCALAIKAATTKRTIAGLCKDGSGDDAMCLARVIIENAVLMGWMLNEPERTRLQTYILFSGVLRERLVEIVAKFYGDNPDLVESVRQTADPYRQAIAREVFGGKHDTWAYFPSLTRPRKLQRVGIKDMFLEVTGERDSFAYELPYVRGSQFVHSGPLSIFEIARTLKNRDVFCLEPIPSPEPASEALAISNVGMLLALAALDDYAALGLDAQITEIMQAFKEHAY
jgi:hypothetical protein